MNGTIDMERALIVETAASAVDEVTKLLQIDEPLWIKSASEGRCILHRGSYEKIFLTRANFNIRSFTNGARFESSKHSGIVTMSAMHLVDAFLDSDKWGDIFPTIVTKEKTIQALEKGALENRHGSLHMMYEKMHILSPLVPSREFCFLRHCRQIEHGTWVIADVSYDFSKECVFPSRSWRLPSGCMIEDMSNGSSKVTWVEHVHVDDKSQTNRLYRDLVCGSHNIAYGAERWILTLKRMCERFTYFSKLPETTATADNGFGRVIIMAEGKQSVMNLSHRMVKNFCGTLNMSGKLDFPQLAEVTNSGVRVSVREATETGQPSGIIVGAATSLWLPLPPQAVFDFFRDDKTRFQWDVLSNGYPVHEIEHISTGAHPGNCISIIRPFIPTENNMLMLQESCIDRLGSLIVYAPIDVTTLNMAITGQDSSAIPILPSGFIISADGRGTNHRSTKAASTSSSGTSGSSSSGGSLLTVAFQILVSCKQLNVESVAAVNTLISSTVQKIKSSLNCSNDLD
ncbi:homeobox-leucine zipper protein HDG11 [Morus notabilis]|nr:homeobox-leucine zipper protein HDG11 [Morus notabilis]